MENQEERTPMQEERVFFEQPTTVAREGGKGKIWAAVLFVILLLAGLASWFVVKGRNEVVTPTPTPAPAIIEQEPTPSPTPPAIDKSKIRIEVFNGTGIAGEAAVLKGRLVPLGYSQITTANATTQNNTTTEIAFAASVPQELRTELISLLDELYENVRTGSNITQNQLDIRIITGLRKGVVLQPSPSSSPKSSPTATPRLSPSPSPTS